MKNLLLIMLLNTGFIGLHASSNCENAVNADKYYNQAYNYAEKWSENSTNQEIRKKLIEQYATLEKDYNEWYWPYVEQIHNAAPDEAKQNSIRALHKEAFTKYFAKEKELRFALLDLK